MAESRTLLHPEVLLSMLPSKSSRSIEEEDDDERKVGFYKYTEVREVLHRKDYTKKERELSWYTNSEKDQMRKKQHKILKQMDAGLSTGYHRGLECYTELGHDDLNENIETYVDFVREAQERLWQEGYYNWDLIARVARQLSQHCMIEALERAQGDAKRARKAYTRMGVEKKDLRSLQRSSTASSSSSSSPAESSSSTKSTTEKKKLVIKKKKKNAAKSDGGSPLEKRISSIKLSPAIIPIVEVPPSYLCAKSITRTFSMPVNTAAALRSSIVRTPSMPQRHMKARAA